MRKNQSKFEMKMNELSKMEEGGEIEKQQVEKIKRLGALHEKLKHELESSSNRLQYARLKVGGAKESLDHAQEVLRGQKSPTPNTNVRKMSPTYNLQETTTSIKQDGLARVSFDKRSGSLDKQFVNTLKQDQSLKQLMRVSPGYLTSLVKQVRKNSRSQQKIDLETILRQSLQNTTSENELANPILKNLQRAHTSIELEPLVDTARILNQRKQNTGIQ